MTSKDLCQDVEALSKASLQDLDAHLRKLAEEKKELELKIRLGNHYRNKFAHPNRLPPELLSEIFKIYTAQVRSGACLGDSDTGTRIPTSWIRFTHVCQVWREVGIACKSVWSDLILDSNANFSRMMLQRSGNTPLNIVFTSLPSKPRRGEPNPCLFEALTHSKRLRIVNIALRVRRSSETLQELYRSLADIGNEARALKDLSLADFGGTALVVPPTLLQNGISSLTSLKLESVNFEWDALRLPSTLKAMHIERNGDGNERLSSWDTLRHHLKQVPRLETLRLTSIFPTTPRTAISEPVTLRHLKHASFGDLSLYMIGLFDMIRIPSSASVDVDLFDDAFQSQYSRLTSGICAARTDEHSPQSQAKQVVEEIQLRENADGDPLVQVRFLRPEGYSEESPGYDVNISFWTTSHSNHFLRDLVAGFNEHCNIRPTLSHLQIYCMEAFSSNIIAELFGTLPKLKKMTCYTYITIQYVAPIIIQDPALIPEDDDDLAPDHPRKPRFPALEALAFADDSIDDIRPADFAELLSALANRPLGHRISTMEFESTDRLVSEGIAQVVRDGLPDVEVLLQ